MDTLSDKTVLVADDEEHIRQLVKLYFQSEGCTISEATTGKEVLGVFAESAPDLLILDVMLPELDGWEVLKQIRRSSNVPVIMLTAKDAEMEKILGLELGADDYVTKPFSPRELVSRAKAVLRRCEPAILGQPGEHKGRHMEAQAFHGRSSEIVRYPGLTIDRTSREVTVNGTLITGIPPKEFDLLWLLASNPNRVFTRENLLETVWEYTYFGDIRTVDVHIRRIRQKIEKDPENPEFIKTVWGVGYKFEYHPE